MLGLYYARRFLTAFLRVFIIVAGLVFLGDFLENVRRYSSFDDALTRAATSAALRVPTLISQSLPIIVMLAGVTFSVGLARFNEFIVSRAAGLSALRSLFPTMVVALLLGAISVLFFNPFAAYLLEKRETLNAVQQQSEPTISVNENGYWMRQTSEAGHMILWADRAENNGRALRQVTAIDYNAEGQAITRLQADVALLDDNQWIFSKGKRWDLRPQIPNPELFSKTFSLMRIPTSITPDQILGGFPAPETISVWELPQFSAQIEEAGFSALKYHVHFQSELARPLLFLAMVAIGMMFTLQNARLGNLGVAVLLALGCGFGLHFLQSFSKTLGDAGEIAAVIAAWFPAIAACFLALATFLHLEDG